VGKNSDGNYRLSPLLYALVPAPFSALRPGLVSLRLPLHRERRNGVKVSRPAGPLAAEPKTYPSNSRWIDSTTKFSLF
jgi:hypothetical protein